MCSYTSRYLHDTVLFSHLLGREVGVCSGTIPILHWFRIERDDDTVFLGKPMQDVASDPEVVGGTDAHRWAHLELPLRGHHLGIGTRDRYTSIQAASNIKQSQMLRHV